MHLSLLLAALLLLAAAARHDVHCAIGSFIAKALHHPMWIMMGLSRDGLPLDEGSEAHLARHITDVPESLSKTEKTEQFGRSY